MNIHHDLNFVKLEIVCVYIGTCTKSDDTCSDDSNKHQIVIIQRVVHFILVLHVHV